MNLCPVDGSEVLGDRIVCPACEGGTRGRLRAVPELLDECDTSIARIGASGIRGAAGTGTCPRVEGDDGQLHPCRHEPDSPTCTEGAALGFGLAASEAAMQLRVVLHGWARVWDEESPVREGDGTVGPLCRLGGLCPHRSCLPILEAEMAQELRRARDRALSTSAGQARMLADAAWAGRAWAGDLVTEVRAAVRQAEHAIDRAPDLQLAGTCTCGMAVYCEVGQRTARCRWCNAVHDPAELYDGMLLARGRLYVAPAAVIARMLVDPVTGEPLTTAAAIRGYRFRGALEVAETNPAGQPCYRVADVVDLVRNGADNSRADVT